MTVAGKHHNSALCHIATTLLTRIITCWRNNEPYQLRDVDGRVVDAGEAKAIITAHYRIPDNVRRKKRSITHSQAMKRGRADRREESQSAPSVGPPPV